MATRKKSAGLRTRAAFNDELHPHLTGRLARTKRILSALNEMREVVDALPTIERDDG